MYKRQRRQPGRLKPMGTFERLRRATPGRVPSCPRLRRNLGHLPARDRRRWHPQRLRWTWRHRYWSRRPHPWPSRALCRAPGPTERAVAARGVCWGQRQMQALLRPGPLRRPWAQVGLSVPNGAQMPPPAQVGLLALTRLRLQPRRPPRLPCLYRQRQLTRRLAPLAATKVNMFRRRRTRTIRRQGDTRHITGKHEHQRWARVTALKRGTTAEEWRNHLEYLLL